MLVKHDRPRDLRWYLAGPMFFGDLGTSRFYVLGLALFYAGLAAPIYVAGICTLVIAVGWAYTVICRVQPDGGGVYSSGRMLHPTLGAIGAILLIANYVVTAAISTYEAVIYIGIPLGMARELAPWFTVIAIAALGALNWVGPRRAGTFALLVAVAAIIVSFLLAAFTIQHLPEGWRAFQEQRPTGVAPSRMWLNLVYVVLALSGVESIANMTGIMVPPVARTAKKSIWPVIAEVVVLNLILIVIACSLSTVQEAGVIVDQDASSLTPEQVHRNEAIKEHVLEVVARQYVHPAFATVASIIFGLLLLSATNTAIIAMISILYAMSRDRELPSVFSRINEFGVPVYGLIVACVLATIVTLTAANLGKGTLETLAKMYAIGVVGAIVINLGSCVVNKKLAIRVAERGGMVLIGVLLFAIWVTIPFTNIPALVFIVCMLVGGLSLRFIAHRVPVAVPALVEAAPAAGVAAEAVPAGELLPFDPGKGRILVASRGNLKLLRFAFDEARRRDANIFVLYVRDLAVLYPGQAHPMTPEEDLEASALFRNAEGMARDHSVPMQPIYCVSRDPADVILDFSATYAVDLVILGVSRRAGVLRALRGDVIAGVADNLPAESTLLIHA
jgi:amino acid transporter/nucleotide-binding universal stress UspA family protein